MKRSLSPLCPRSVAFPCRTVVAAVFGLAMLLVSSGETAAQEEEPAKEISLEWLYKKKDLGIDDPMEFLPGGFQWSPEGHLLAFGQKTHQYGRILVVMDPDTPADRVVLTELQIRDLLEELHQNKDGMTPASRMDYSEATTEGEPIASEDEGESQIDDEKDASEEKEEQGEQEDKNSIRSFSWLEKENRISFKLDGKRILFDPSSYLAFPDPEPDLGEGEKENLDRSPDDRYAAYTRDHDLYVFDFENLKEIRLTQSGSDTVLNGKFPWVYWEELMSRRSYRAFYWSPQADTIAFLQFDQEEVSTYPITDFSEAVPRTYMQRYPKVGTRNPSVRLGIVSLSNRETRWVDLGEPHEYIINVAWKPDGSALTVQTLNRRQNRLGLYEVDPLTARGQLILEETRDTWVEAFEPPRFVEDEDAFVWLSERTGFRHLYLCTSGGRKCRPLTSGSWVVDRPGFRGRSIFLDNAKQRVYFRGTKESPLERHVYWVPLGGGMARRVTRDPGMHSFYFSKDGAYWLDRWTSVDVPRRIDLMDRDGKLVARLGEITADDFAPYRFWKPELLTFEGEGATFYASLLKPVDFDPDRRYPVVAFVYGEPWGQVVQNRWVSSFDMVLANHGFLVFRFDGRGTPGRGRPWLDPIYKNQTDLPMEDWKAAVAHLESLSYVDGNRLGVWGWSAGGTMTLNLMLRTPGLFQAGAAVAAVTDKRLYDTIYTERHLGLLKENEEGYKKSSPLFAAENLEGQLLIAHGISDDNVHVQNVYNLIELLTKAEKGYQLYLYPQKKHGIRGDDVQFHLFERILEFFESTLSPG